MSTDVLGAVALVDGTAGVGAELLDAAGVVGVPSGWNDVVDGTLDAVVAAGVVVTLTIAGAGFGAGRTKRYVVSVTRNRTAKRTVDVRTR
jgi:hypothetical protein